MYNLVSAPIVQSHYYPANYSNSTRYQPYQTRPINNHSNNSSSDIMDPFALPPYYMPGAYNDQRPATLTTIQWEDEKTFCYLVEIKGVSVGRRKDNNMINGTKLLNLSGMTRGKRDGILKSEIERSVIRSGLMVLKGVWISFERAIELAKEYGVFELVHPLLEWDIESYYYRSILDVSPPTHPYSNNDNRWFMPFPAPLKTFPSHHNQKLPLQYYSLPTLVNQQQSEITPLSIPMTSQPTLQSFSGVPNNSWEPHHQLPLYTPAPTTTTILSSGDGSYSDTILPPTANTSPLNYYYNTPNNPNLQYHY